MGVTLSVSRKRRQKSFTSAPVLSFEFKASILILSAVPCASMVANLAEMVHHEEETSCNMVVLSTICSVITIPLVSLLLNI